MAKFKTGDRVWYFTTRNPKDKDDIQELWGIFDIDWIYLGTRIFEEGFEEEFYCYPSKRDALNDLARLLKGFVDDESIDKE